MIGVRTAVAGIPSMTWGPPSGSVLLAVHGAHGDKQDAVIRRAVGVAVPMGYQVVSVDLPGHGERDDADRLVPWACAPELAEAHQALVTSGSHVDLFACSLGAYFSLLALADREIGRALLMAPLVDMVAYVKRLMVAYAVSDARLRDDETIQLTNGQLLDWRYLTYAQQHPVCWPHPTDILWGKRDEVVPEADILAFAASCNAPIRRIDAGHAFTATQDLLVDDWLAGALADCSHQPGGQSTFHPTACRAGEARLTIKPNNPSGSQVNESHRRLVASTGQRDDPAASVNSLRPSRGESGQSDLIGTD